MSRAERRRAERMLRKSQSVDSELREALIRARREANGGVFDPLDPCPNGHPEQMLLLASGVPPHPCELCGTTPKFEDAEFGCERCGSTAVTNIGSPCGCEQCASCGHIPCHDDDCAMGAA